MRAEMVVGAIVALLISAVLTGVIRKLAHANGLLDVPNQRSSHVVPTPRGGGVGIVIGASVTAVLLASRGLAASPLLLTLLIGGAAVALVGFFDDRHKLAARTRLAVHVAAAVVAVLFCEGLPPMRLGEDVIELGWPGYVLAVLGIVWSLNFFNFMDGIDGIAASEGAFVTLSGAGIALLTGASAGVPALAIATGAACLGFLIWNWPPAKIFMGDTGSGYIGYVIAVLALFAARENPVALLVWLILGALFFVDATVTLARRVARRERASDAHRSHAYQWLARRWQSHKRVTLTTIAINVLWLLPCALFAAAKPQLAGWMVVIALVPIIVGALVAGAGRSESRAG